MLLQFSQSPPPLFPLRILIDYKGVGLFLGTLFCSIDLYVCFYASIIPGCFDYYALIVQFDIGQHDSSNFVLSRYPCCYMGPFVVLQKFLKYQFQFCEIHHWNLDRNCVEPIDCFGQQRHFNDVNLPYLCTQHVLVLICIFFNFFLQCLIIF